MNKHLLKKLHCVVTNKKNLKIFDVFQILDICVSTNPIGNY